MNWLHVPSSVSDLSAKFVFSFATTLVTSPLICLESSFAQMNSDFRRFNFAEVVKARLMVGCARSSGETCLSDSLELPVRFSSLCIL